MLELLAQLFPNVRLESLEQLLSISLILVTFVVSHPVKSKVVKEEQLENIELKEISDLLKLTEFGSFNVFRFLHSVNILARL